MIFLTPYTYDCMAPFVFDDYSSEEPSQCVPDQALTIRELYERYARGQSLDVHDYGFDTGADEDFDDAHDLVYSDKADLSLHAFENRNNIALLKQEVDNYNKQKENEKVNRTKDEVAEAVGEKSRTDESADEGTEDKR